jgi:hypothetical protein
MELLSNELLSIKQITYNFLLQIFESSQREECAKK